MGNVSDLLERYEIQTFQCHFGIYIAHAYVKMNSLVNVNKPCM